jgi:GNAT superfamily N-acetyltransferase
LVAVSVDFHFEPARAEDLEQLVGLRIAAMRESLTTIGRFDPVRARERFASGFEPAWTRHIVVHGERVGFVVLKPKADGLLLDHLYVSPGAQGRGLGGAVLGHVLAEADDRGLVLMVGALRTSRANRFYERHGFTLDGEGEWDLYYRREPCVRK